MSRAKRSCPSLDEDTGLHCMREHNHAPPHRVEVEWEDEPVGSDPVHDPGPEPLAAGQPRAHPVPSAEQLAWPAMSCDNLP